MKNKSFPHLQWTIIGLVCVAGLLAAGFTEIRGRYALSQLQQGPLLLQVPGLRQSTGTSCGEAVIAMTHNYAHPEASIGEQEVIAYAAANDYYTPERAPYTSPASMLKIASHYTDHVSTGSVFSSGQALSLLIERLKDGEPVIIDVLSNFRDPKSEAHFIVVTGLALDASRGNAVVVYYNDPLTGTSRSGDWTGREGVWHAWQTNGDPGGSGWWMVIS